jgi:hypothetical protein
MLLLAAATVLPVLLTVGLDRLCRGAGRRAARG